MSAVEWTSERIKVLMGLWEEGLPTSEIGRRLGVTKNAVVGKVHRLGLKKRQSPIRQASSGTTVVKKVRAKVGAETLAEKPQTAPVRPAAMKTVRSRGEVVRLEELTSAMCCWPEGEPGTAEFHFCGKPSLAEKPYCVEHCERAYVKVSKSKKSKGFEAA